MEDLVSNKTHVCGLSIDGGVFLWDGVAPVWDQVTVNDKPICVSNIVAFEHGFYGTDDDLKGATFVFPQDDGAPLVSHRNFDGNFDDEGIWCHGSGSIVSILGAVAMGEEEEEEDEEEDSKPPAAVN